MAFGHLILAMLLQQRFPDPVHGAEAAEMLLKAQTVTHRESTQQRGEKRRRFEKKFNTVVGAVEAFGKKYNDGHGKIWPKQEADALRKAIRELQKALTFE